MSYDDFASTFSNSRKNLRWGEIEYFAEYIKNRFPDNKVSVLDVGCGNGRLLETLEASGLPYSYLGIDESVGMVDEAKKLHPDHTFRVLDMNHIEELSDSNDSFDVIVFIASFHHLHTKQERKEVLEKTRKLLKKGGIIMMTNWNLLGEVLFEKYEKSHGENGDFQIKIGAHNRYYHGFSEEELPSLFGEG